MISCQAAVTVRFTLPLLVASVALGGSVLPAAEPLPPTTVAMAAPLGALTLAARPTVFAAGWPVRDGAAAESHRAAEADRADRQAAKERVFLNEFLAAPRLFAPAPARPATESRAAEAAPVAATVPSLPADRPLPTDFAGSSYDLRPVAAEGMRPATSSRFQTDALESAPGSRLAPSAGWTTPARPGGEVAGTEGLAAKFTVVGSAAPAPTWSGGPGAADLTYQSSSPSANNRPVVVSGFQPTVSAPAASVAFNESRVFASERAEVGSGGYIPASVQPLVTASTQVNLYVAGVPSGTQSVAYKVTTSGTAASTTTSTFATFPASSGADGAAFDKAGNLYIAAGGQQQIYKVARNGSYTTFATLSNAAQPVGLAFDSGGNLYTDDVNGNVLKISATGAVSTFATINTTNSSTGAMTNLLGLAIDGSNNVFVANQNSSQTEYIEKITPAGVVSTFATLIGTGNSSPNIGGLTLDSAGNLYVAEQGTGRIDKYTSSGTMSLYVNLGTNVAPNDLKFDGSGNLYVVGQGGTVLEVAASTLTVTTLASGLGNLGGLAIDPIPEPATWFGAALLLGATGLTLRRRLRRI